VKPLIARVALDHGFPVVNIATHAEEGQMFNEVISDGRSGTLGKRSNWPLAKHC